MEQKETKKLFLIGVTDDSGSKNRIYTDCILDLLSSMEPFSGEYTIEPHYKLPKEDLYLSLDKALRGEKYEGYIVITDCLEGETWNPNVMYEFGAIRYMNSPYVLITSQPEANLPFDIRPLSTVKVPQTLIDYVDYCFQNNISPDTNNYFTEQNIESELLNEIRVFVNKVYEDYKESFKARIGERLGDLGDNSNTLLKEVREIKLLLSNTAEYIDGEKAAFKALQEAVNSAKFSLRTTRFANESIVAQKSTKEQTGFMESLYEKSGILNKNFDRIICNNHPAKWNDIYNILFYGGNSSKVYVRKHTYSIHFELVVIDEEMAFIHFYQTDNERKSGDAHNEVEKLNSTLKIKGRSICQKLANIFDRLHHRDFENEYPSEPSRTLLGLPTKESDWDKKYALYGRFVVDNAVPRYSPYQKNLERRNVIIKMFKDAFQNWIFEDDAEDKINMAAGIALVEGSDKFLNKMKEINRLNDDEYNKAMELVKANKDT